MFAHSYYCLQGLPPISPKERARVVRFILTSTPESCATHLCGEGPTTQNQTSLLLKPRGQPACVHHYAGRRLLQTKKWSFPWLLYSTLSSSTSRSASQLSTGVSCHRPFPLLSNSSLEKRELIHFVDMVGCSQYIWKQITNYGTAMKLF